MRRLYIENSKFFFLVLEQKFIKVYLNPRGFPVGTLVKNSFTIAGDMGQRSLAVCSPWGHKESDTT